MEKKKIKIDSLHTENLQIRVEMLDECVNDYAAIYREKPEELPPVTAFYDVALDKYYLGDGFHRLAAAKLNGAEAILAEVHEGTFEDALRYALKANARNGIKRTVADKRHAVEVAWAQWDKLYRHLPRTTDTKLPSARQLADITGTSVGFCHAFIDNGGVFTVNTPQTGKLSGKAMLCTQQADCAANALTPTHQHLEERNVKLSGLLREGMDRYGMEIPERLKPAFLSREPQAFLRDLGIVRTMLDKKRMSGDPVFIPFISYAMRDLDAVIRDIRSGAVHCVCRMCRGRGCGSCSNLGFQTKAQYERNPSEFKAGE